jgi:dTDP-4-dehydrorhamnose reductase
MNNILITGGSGMVGSQADFGIKPSRVELDITKPETIEAAISRYKPTAILHLAAMTNMLGCEQDPKQAQLINVEGTRNLAKACKQHGIKLAYLSTGAVFGADKRTPFSETDQTDPINIYGHTKLDGEKATQTLLPDALIVRTSWLFGGSKEDTKFVKKTFDKLSTGTEVKATSDRVGSPTYVNDLLGKIKELIEQKEAGIFHVVNSGVASYFEIAQEIKKIGNFTAAVTPVKAAEIESQELKRGSMEALSSSKVQLRSWQEALSAYIDELGK